MSQHWLDARGERNDFEDRMQQGSSIGTMVPARWPPTAM
jgi:hypothetical protein